MTDRSITLVQHRDERGLSYSVEEDDGPINWTIGSGLTLEEAMEEVVYVFDKSFDEGHLHLHYDSHHPRGNRAEHRLPGH